MATYLELRNLFNDGDLVNRTTVAITISVNDLLSGSPTANDKKYAESVLSNPQEEARKILMTILASNSSATVAQIQSATDATLQTKVDAVVPHLVDALAGV